MEKVKDMNGTAPSLYSSPAKQRTRGNKISWEVLAALRALLVLAISLLITLSIWAQPTGKGLKEIRETEKQRLAKEIAETEAMLDAIENIQFWTDVMLVANSLIIGVCLSVLGYLFYKMYTDKLL